jgi:hypothetical protein
MYDPNEGLSSLVSKSYVPYRGYVKATHLADYERAGMRAGLQAQKKNRLYQKRVTDSDKYTQRYGPLEGRGRPKADQYNNKRAWGHLDTQPSTPSSKVKNLHFGPSVTPEHQQKVEATLGARKLKRPTTLHTSSDDVTRQMRGVTANRGATTSRQQVVLHEGVYDGDNFDHILHHEITHADRGKSQRPAQWGGTRGNKGAGEEARADHVALQYAPKGRSYYQRVPDINPAYHNVRNKLVNAQVSKAAWKNFYPAPPMRSGAIRKIPLREANITSTKSVDFGNQHFTSQSRRGKDTGGINVSTGGDWSMEPKGHIDSVGVHPGFRRRGLATRLFDAAKKEIPETYHAPTRTAMGEKYARAEAKRTGKPRQIETNRWLDDNPNRKKRALANKADLMRETNNTSRTGHPVRGKVAGLKRPGALWDRTVRQFTREKLENLKPLPFEKAGHNSGGTVRDQLAQYGKKEGFTVKKSYIGGGQWRAATKLTPKQALKVPGAHLKKPRLGNNDRKFKAQYGTGKIRRIVEAEPQGIRKEPGGWINGGGTARIGSGSHGKSYVMGASNNPRSHKVISAHEGAHAAPARSSYRLHGQIGNNPTKLMREEARADFIGHGKHYTKARSITEATPYGTAANFRDASLAHPNRPARGSKLVRDSMRDYGGKPDFPRPTNKLVYEGAKQQIVSTNMMISGGSSAYGKNGSTPDKAVDGYRDVQNRMRAAKERKVSKSYLGAGKGWVRAGQAGAKALRRAKGAHKAARGMSDESQFYLQRRRNMMDLVNAARDLGTEEKMANGATKVSVSPFLHRTLREAEAYAVKTGNRPGQGFLVVSDEGAPATTIAHEMAHLGPRRSAYRLHHQIAPDGRKILKEEARADMAGDTYYRDDAAQADHGSGYTQAARKGKYRRMRTGLRNRASNMSRQALYGKPAGEAIKEGWKTRPWSKGSMDDFRNVQDKIGAAQGHPHAPGGGKKHKFYGNQYVERDQIVPALIALGGTAGAGGGYAAYRHHQKQDEHAIEKGMLNNLGAKVGAHYNVGLNRVANAIEPKPVAPVVRRTAPVVRSNGRTYGAPPKQGALTRVANHPIVRPVRSAAADQIRDVAHDATPLWDQVEGYIGKRAPQSFNPHDGISSEVSKMSPDPSSVHVMGALGGPTRSKVAGERRRRGTYKRVIGA